MSTNESLTLSIAAYAAIVSTFVLVWDIYKWLKSGPKVRLAVSKNMRIIGGNIDPNVYIAATVVNLGDRTTTITHLSFLYYNSWFKAAFRRSKPDEAFAVTTPSPAQPLPYMLDPGAQWVGFAEQDHNVERMINSGHLFVVLNHTHGDKGIRRKLG